MFRIKFLCIAVMTVVTIGAITESAQAGPLLDWLRGRFGRNRCCTALQPAVPVTAASPCNTCQTSCTQTCQRTVVNYVPYTAYRTSWECVPVTSYRPQSNTDPCTGCTVTCMRPCTTYSYRAKQVPYTTYRPVYSTQTYQVPMTITSQAPAVGGCNTCSLPATFQQFQQPVTGMPATTVPTITGSTINTNGSFTTTPSTGTPTPADTQPQLQQRPIIIEQPSNDGSAYRMNVPRSQNWPTESTVTPVADPQPQYQWQNEPPQLFGDDPKSAQSPVYEKFAYTPVRYASTASPNLSDAANDAPQRVFYGTVTRSGSSNQNQQPASGWKSLANTEQAPQARQPSTNPNMQWRSLQK